MNIGLVSLCEVAPNSFLAINCAKGRGLILPGGRWVNSVFFNGGFQQVETFIQGAARELFEETGCVANTQKFLFAGMTPCLAYSYTFETTIHGYTPKDSSEGRVCLASRNELMTSFFGPYYELMFQVRDKHGT